MRRSPLPYKQVIFVCTNARAPGERVSCGGEGRCGVEVLEKLKKFIKDNNLKDVARAAKSGCQEKCEIGPNAMLLPQNELLSGLTPADADALIETYLKPLVKKA
ncbi:MAG: (2Fe-2S) ferredoxin domain-containing protein [Elusimicrobia bacterium]|nr:(2Fe-2S) ferredoxin domain-containing protein [Elusimicrobiota bacterium]